MYQADVLTGHNNDQGALEITGLKQFLIRHQVDSGYHYCLLETPNNMQSYENNN